MKFKSKKNQPKKKNKQKSFFFEDYDTNQILNKKSNGQISVSFDRIFFIYFFFICISIIFILKTIYISVSKNEALLINNNPGKKLFYKQNITDRNGLVLAGSIDIYSAGIRPHLIVNKKKLILDLKLIFPNLNYNVIKKKIENKKFFYLKKRLTEEQKNKLWLTGHKSIIFEKKQFRIYPQKSLFSHVIGQIDDDNIGISGLEKYIDNELNKNHISDKKELVTSLDGNLQFLIREELLKASKDFQTIGSAAILMDVNNGEILSLISLPDQDLNLRLNNTNHAYINKITKGVYELGSVFKTFTVAAGLENNVVNKNTEFKNLKNKITCDGRIISEHGKLSKNLTVEDILVQSSNIGAIRIAQKIGESDLKKFFNLLELFNKIDLEIEEIGMPLNFRWGKCKLATASFGHGITTTPLQLAKAYATLTNGGYKVKPTLLKKSSSIQDQKKIISSETSNIIKSMLKKVVSQKEGTANFANVEGYDVGGKTGTALKSINGNYTKRKFNTFVSVFPTKKPEYVLVVILDEPKPAPQLVYNIDGKKIKNIQRNEAGWNSVYVSGKIINKIGPILAIKNLQASKNF